MTDKLKPCPFCGGEATVYDYEAEYDIYDPDTLGYVDTEHHTKYGVCCNTCKAMMPEFNSEEAAIISWNNRSPMDRIVEQLEKSAEGVKEKANTLPEIESAGFLCGWVALKEAIKIVKGVQNETSNN